MIMLDYKRILVPYDGSEYAKRALDRAVSMARCCDGAKLFIATRFPADAADGKKSRGKKHMSLMPIKKNRKRKTPGRLFWMIQKNSFPRIFLMN